MLITELFALRILLLSFCCYNKNSVTLKKTMIFCEYERNVCSLEMYNSCLGRWPQQLESFDSSDPFHSITIRRDKRANRADLDESVISFSTRIELVEFDIIVSMSFCSLIASFLSALNPIPSLSLSLSLLLSSHSHSSSVNRDFVLTLFVEWFSSQTDAKNYRVKRFADYDFSKQNEFY